MSTTRPAAVVPSVFESVLSAATEKYAEAWRVHHLLLTRFSVDCPAGPWSVEDADGEDDVAPTVTSYDVTIRTSTTQVALYGEVRTDHPSEDCARWFDQLCWYGTSETGSR